MTNSRLTQVDLLHHDLSYWPNIEPMTAFTKGEPTKVHLLKRDPELLIELPDRIEIHHILVDERLPR